MEAVSTDPAPRDENAEELGEAEAALHRAKVALDEVTARHNDADGECQRQVASTGNVTNAKWSRLHALEEEKRQATRVVGWAEKRVETARAAVRAGEVEALFVELRPLLTGAGSAYGCTKALEDILERHLFPAWRALGEASAALRQLERDNGAAFARAMRIIEHTHALPEGCEQPRTFKLQEFLEFVAYQVGQLRAREARADLGEAPHQPTERAALLLDGATHGRRIL